jgi:hypothetical protein
MTTKNSVCILTLAKTYKTKNTVYNGKPKSPIVTLKSKIVSWNLHSKLKTMRAG